MNIFLFFLLICFVPTEVFAQNDNISPQKYFPEGMSWKEVLAEPYDEPGMPMDTTFAVIYEIGTDTIVNNVKYNKVLKNGEYSGKLIREQNNQVWLKVEDYPEEIKLYDFNWDSADTIRTEYVDVYDDVKTLCTDEMYFSDIQTTRLGDRLFQYHKDINGVIIREIGRVSELVRDGCLLGYKVENPVVPGLTYWKVLWLKREGKTVFSSDSPEEWIDFVPEQILRGDVNNDGIVDINDVMLIVNIILNGQ
ncbi:MAG: hypothetical protein IKR05_09505 [Prevotella sp.]|jgi:hypothetical protein|nr:hypothetical protein [Prevotella sp.]